MSRPPKLTRVRLLMVSDGSCIHARRPLQWVQELGYDVAFADFGESSSLALDNPQVIQYPKIRGRKLLSSLFGASIGGAIADKLQIAKVRKLVAEIQPDIIHVHWVGEAAWALSSLQFPNLVLTAWGSDINQFYEAPLNLELKKKVSLAFMRCRILLSDTDDIRIKAENLAGQRLDFRLLTLGVDFASFQDAHHEKRIAWRTKLGIKEDTVLFGAVRAWHPVHNHEKILEAFATAVRESQEPMALLFKLYHPSGNPKDFDYELHIRERVAALGLADSVIWIQNLEQNEVPDLYSALDVVVNFPERDALPVSFFEAAAARKLVITRRLPAYDIPLVTENFIVVDDLSVTALAEAMQAAVRGIHLDLHEKEIERACNEVREKYSVDASKTTLDAIYKEIVAGQTA